MRKSLITVKSPRNVQCPTVLLLYPLKAGVWMRGAEGNRNAQSEGSRVSLHPPDKYTRLKKHPVVLLGVSFRRKRC